MRKLDFGICENKYADQLAVIAQLISAFVFATRIAQSLYFLNPKFQASNHLLRMYSPVYVGHPEDRFSHDAALIISAHNYWDLESINAGIHSQKHTPLYYTDI